MSAESTKFPLGVIMRKIKLEMHLDMISPEVAFQDLETVVVKLGSNMAYEDVRKVIGGVLAEDEWVEFRSIWSEDELTSRRFEILESGALRIERG